MQLFLDENDKPIIPKCGNCIHWTILEKFKERSSLGYCKKIKLLFAFTGKSNVYAMTKDFYSCDKHEHIHAEKIKERGKVKEFASIEEAIGSK